MRRQMSTAFSLLGCELCSPLDRWPSVQVPDPVRGAATTRVRRVLPVLPIPTVSSAAGAVDATPPGSTMVMWDSASERLGR